MAIAIGDQIGDYEVLGRLGAGGIGEVYKVRHLIFHRIEALKILLSGQIGAADMVERFLREIRVVASLSHPNIAALHTAFRHKNELAMIMEYVDGVTLASRVATRGLGVDESIGYIGQVLSALKFAHERGVIHRDIKSANIMLTAGNTIKLLDFGLAVTERDPKLTRSGFVLGSLHYMSPEQVQGTPLDARSDLYSVGITLYEALTRKLPITGSSDYAILSAHMHQMPRPPAEVNPAVSMELSQVVLKSLAKQPEGRYQTAAEFLSALNGASKVAMETVQRDAASAVTRDWASPGNIPAPSGTNQSAGSPTLQAASPSPTPTAPIQSPSGAKKSPPSDAQLEEIGKELAIYVGPIAKILVKRAAGRHSSLTDIYAALGKEIESAKDREKFLASRKMHGT